MTIAELFINIGVKNEGTAAKALTNVKSGVEEVRSSSLAAKAAVVALFYAVEQMTSAAAAKGGGLMNLSAGLGMAPERLQSMRNAFREVNVSAEEVDGTLTGIQKTVTAISQNKGISPEFGRFATAVHLDRSRIQDLSYMMQKAQEYAKMNANNPGLIKTILGGGLGISDNMISGMIRNKHTDLSKSIGPIESAGMIQQLDRVNAAWARLRNNMEIMRDKGVAKFGLFAVDEIGHAVAQISKLADAIGKLVEKDPAIGKLLVGLAAIAALSAPFGALGVAIGSIVTLLGEMDKHANDKSGLWYWMNKKDLDKDIGGFFKNMFSTDNGFGPKPGEGQDTKGPTNVSPTINIHTDTKDPHRHAQMIHKEIKNAVFQSTALTQVT